MNIIFKLTLQYMKKNRRRTMIAVAGITAMMVVLTAVYIFANAFLGVLRAKVSEEEGAYHLIFHELNEEQCQKLAEDKRVKNCVVDVPCPVHDSEGIICAQVEMKKVNLSIFGKSQKMAKKLGMKKLSKDEQFLMPDRKLAKYNVTEHTELLNYYNINSEENNGISVGVLINMTLVMLALIGSAFIYNAYSISVFEKLKYLGTLGNVGASGLQKSLVVYWEGVLEGCVGIPLGIVLGIILSKISLYGVAKYFMFTGGLPSDITFIMIVKLVFAGVLMILLACYTPAVTAAHTTGMELISGQIMIDKSMRHRTNLLKKHRFLGLSGTLALKNIYARRKNYIFNGLLVMITFCVLLDGVSAMRVSAGVYDIKDERKRPKLELWVELYTENAEKINAFYKRVSELDKIKTISLERILDLSGALLDKDQIQDDLEEYEIGSLYGFEDAAKDALDVSTGKKYSGYWICPQIIGLDEQTFRSYVEKAGYDVPENVQYPVLIEDYVRIQEGEDRTRRSILKPKFEETFSFLYSRYGDMDGYALFETGNYGGKIDEILKSDLYAIGMTKEAPPYPYFSGDDEDIEGHQALDSGIHKFYMSMENFEKLLLDPAYKDTYGEHPVDSVVEYNYTKDIPACMKFDINRTSDDKIKEDKEIRKQVEAIAAEIGLTKEDYCFNSSSIWKREWYLNSKGFLKIVLGYGVVLFIAIISLTNILQNISTSMRMHKREFSMYQSMGMTTEMLRKTLMIENTAYGVIGCVLGIPMSFVFLKDMWHQFSESRAINWSIPWELVGVQVILAIILVVVPMLHTKAQMEHLNIIETIRDENV